MRKKKEKAMRLKYRRKENSMGRKGIKSRLLMCLVAASTAITGILGNVPLSVKAAGAEESYEAMIGGTGYEELENAFENAQAGDTITVLKDCSVSGTLVVTADNITLTSGDTGNPATISRDEEFTGKSYKWGNLPNALLAVEGGLTMHDIILDGGAVLDEAFNNTGQTWDSPLVYVRGTLAVEDGTILQNNYNTDGNESNNTNRTAGAIHVESGAALTMGGGLIRRCYTNGGGGGIQNEGTLTATAGTITECYARVGGAIELIASGSVSGMTISGNKGWSSAVSIHSGATLSDCQIENNENGAIGVSGYSPVTMEGCTITGNYGQYSSAISYSGTSRTAPFTIRSCTIRGNTTESPLSSAAIDYMTKADLILDGQTVMEGNISAGSEAWDIDFSYNGDKAPVKLGPDFESESKIVLWGYGITPGAFLVDAASNGKEADASQFPWKTSDYKTEEREGNIYLVEIPETYRLIYVANNNSEGLSTTYFDPNSYTSNDTVTIMDREELLPYMEDFTRAGYDFIGWNTMPDGSGTDYMPGQEINLTRTLFLYAKWKAKDPVTITYVYNGGEGEKASEQAVPGINFTFPDAARKDYSFKGWYEDDDLAVFAGNAGEEHPAPEQDTSYYAAWKKAEATVSFDADGGRMEGGDVTAKIGDSITLPDCTKDGYEFVGWYDGDSCVGQAGEEYTVTDDVTLKAHYERKKATVSFDADGGRMEGGDVTAKIGDSITLPDCTKDGYEFVGWYDGDSCVGKAGEDYTVTDNVTLKAHYERKEATVSFDADGGTMEGGDVTAKIGDSITLPDCTKDGYEFVGWYDGDSCVGQAGEDYTVTDDVTLKAHYERKEATVSFDADSGTMEGGDVTAKIGDSITLPECTKDGYEFVGWYDGDSCVGKAGGNYIVTDDVTLKAHYERKEATVSFDADGGKMEGGDVTAKIGDSVTLPDCTKDGYEFVGWYDEESCVGQAGEEYTVSDDVTLKAHYVRKEAPTCTVSFDTDGGKEIAPIKVEKGQSVKLPEAEKDGYIFLGWYTTKEGGSRIDTELTVTEDITLYARWEKEKEEQEERPEATVSFDADGGTMEGGDVTAKIGDSITLPDCTKDGYEFVGWYDGESCVGKAGEDYTVTDDVTLKAHYERKKAKVTFDADGGTMEGGDVTAKIGDSITLPDCSKDGYEFTGWYDGDTCVGQAGEEYTVSDDVTLKAHYEKKEERTYTVTFDANGGKEAVPVKAVKGEKIKLPGTEKAGYVFLGWYTEKENGILLGIAGDEMEVTKDMTVYALWELEKAEDNGDKNPETCRVAFHTEGGTLKNETVTIVKGASLYLPLPEREGYSFTGWYLDQSLTQFAGVYRDSYRITKDTDFYAKWEKTKDDNADQGSDAEATGTYTVKYDANGGITKELSVKVAKDASIKLPTAEREGFIFKGWYTDEQVFVGKAGDTYKPDRDITLYAGWEEAGSGNDNDSDNDNGDDSAAESDSDPDTKAGTSADDSNQDESTDDSVTEDSGNTAADTSGTGLVKEPVIQTGRTSPIYLLAALGMFGILLAAFSIREGKRSSEE